MTGRPRRTADELLRELGQKPEYVERQRERMQQREENRRLYAEAATGLLEDLRAAGFKVSTMAELRQPGVGNKGAVPVLAKWLSNVDYLPLKRDVIAALGSPWARPEAARPLLDEFHRIDPREDKPGGLRWSIGDALERVADESVLDDLIAIATDKREGRDRQLIVTALGNMVRARERVVPLLLQLLDDEEVAAYAVMGLGKLRAGEAKPAIQRFLEHPEPWVRKEARKSLARLAS
jgi:HEAT repeat protein